MANRRLSPDAPYEQSRAALREIYGSRRINASAPQSELDQTPSGRAARLRQAGYSEASIPQRQAEEFRANFGSRLRYAPTNTPTAMVGAASSFTNPLPNAAGGFAAVNPAMGNPVPIDPNYQPPSAPVSIPAPFGGGASSFQPSAPGGYGPVPTNTQVTPLSFNLSTPSPLSATDLAPYVPRTVASYTPFWRRPQQPPSYMSTVLNGASKYLT